MLLEQKALCAWRTSNPPAPKTQKSSTRIVYIVTDTCYPTPTDFENGKGMASIDSVHTTSRAANVRAKKVMFACINPGDDGEMDHDKIIEELRDGLYVGIGINGTEGDRYYARKCEVESKPIDVDEDGSSEEEQDPEDWNVG